MILTIRVYIYIYADNCLPLGERRSRARSAPSSSQASQPSLRPACDRAGGAWLLRLPHPTYMSMYESEVKGGEPGTAPPTAPPVRPQLPNSAAQSRFFHSREPVHRYSTARRTTAGRTASRPAHGRLSSHSIHSRACAPVQYRAPDGCRTHRLSPRARTLFAG
jgi:hypothetical protein